MPSGITHILLVKNLQNVLRDGALKMTLASGRDFLQAGAVGPDLPYASIADNDFFFTTQSELADKFHYVQTYGVPLYALNRLRETMGGLTAVQKRYSFCFFLGYISHIVADGTIHPFIRDKVGDYGSHQGEHRILEMNLDVLLYHHLTLASASPINLNYSNIHDELINFDTSFYPEAQFVGDLFSDAIQDVYKDRYETGLILGWVRGLHRMFSVAEGMHPKIYRIVGFIENFLFKDYDDLRNRYSNLLILARPIDRDVNFAKMPQVHYFDDAIPQFYRRFIPIAEKAYAYLYGGGEPLTERDIFPIDLDTGRPLAANSNLDIVPTFWS